MLFKNSPLVWPFYNQDFSLLWINDAHFVRIGRVQRVCRIFQRISQNVLQLMSHYASKRLICYAIIWRTQFCVTLINCEINHFKSFNKPLSIFYAYYTYMWTVRNYDVSPDWNLWHFQTNCRLSVLAMPASNEVITFIKVVRLFQIVRVLADEFRKCL